MIKNYINFIIIRKINCRYIKHNIENQSLE